MRIGKVFVVGSGIAGLSLAAAMSPHAGEVIVVERDAEPEGPRRRPGVPHAALTHTLMEGGLRAFSELFGDFLGDLAEDGVVPLSMSADLAWWTYHGWAHRLDNAHRLLSCSRPLLEWRIRRIVAALPNVEFRYHTRVTGLLARGDARVHGVRTADGGELTGADLVVDATGRHARGVTWLKELGIGEPESTVVDIGSGHTSVRFHGPLALADPWRGIVLQSAPHTSRRGQVLPIENGEWLLTVVGCLGDRPPADFEGVREFSAGLADPVLGRVLEAVDPIEVAGFRPTGNRRFEFDALPVWPDGFVVVGDAACHFNPVYAQGMTVAAQTALSLRDMILRAGLGPGSGRALQARVTSAGEVAWLTATGVDQGLLAGDAHRPDLRGRYLQRVMNLGRVDAGAQAAALDLLTLCGSPSALFGPRVLRALPRRIPAIPRPRILKDDGDD
ncbi:FAD-dependent oxidoreductase [Nocardia puris]|uniref:Flavin-dependent dehydrogenase n=1 Tax=Nocardia puris TaxID=208602 RepID=A0A366DET2_9NOCA|nr:FAD-dependent monooxygenase [Nocardia puris]RBO88435.1 flavin-dependent dehydrogenase [Nocardia puris]